MKRGGRANARGGGGREAFRKGHQEWKMRRGLEQKAIPHHLATAPLEDEDNEGQQLWRCRVERVSNVRIPQEMVTLGLHESIAAANGTFVWTEHVTPSSSGAITFGIWGDEDAASITRRQIAKSIEDLTKAEGKSRASAQWNKLDSLTPYKRERAVKKWKKEVIRQKYRQTPPFGMLFGSIGYFHWPVKDYRPEDFLGHSCEALDPIRMEHSCYIVFDKDRSAFQVSGNVEDVPKALQRLRKIFFQVSVKEARPLCLYLLDLDESAKVPSHVYLGSYVLPSSHAGAQLGTEKARKCPRGEGFGSVVDGLTSYDPKGVRRAETGIAQALKRLHYYRGAIKMRVRLGTFSATQYMPPDYGFYELEQYQEMIDDMGFEGVVTQELGNQATETRLLSALQKADFLVPQDPMVEDLANVPPTYSATFIFEDDNGRDLRLNISWSEVYDSNSQAPIYTCTSKKWTRFERLSSDRSSQMDPDRIGNNPIIDIALQNLASGRAWHLDVQGSNVVEERRLPEELIKFTHALRIDPTRSSISSQAAGAASADLCFIIFPKVHTPPLRSIQQRISYSYSLKHSPYMLELSKFQTRFYDTAGTGKRSRLVGMFDWKDTTASNVEVREPRWGLQIYRTEWDATFAFNERLQVGAHTDWDADMESWFPRDLKPDDGSRKAQGGKSSNGKEEPGPANTGFGDLLDKMKKVEKFVEGLGSKKSRGI